MKPAIHRSTQIIVDRQALRNNFQHEKQLLNPQTNIFAVVKANAYGHGAVVVATTLSQMGVDGFCVATLDEALELRQAGLQEPILVLGITPVQQAKIAAQADISLTVATLKWLEDAAAVLEQPLKVHLALDTGMGRIGLTKERKYFKLVILSSNIPNCFLKEFLRTLLLLMRWTRNTSSFR